MNYDLKIRQKNFESLLKLGNNRNKKNWEMLCSCDNPLVPFIGAGISAWCYKTWNELLTDIVAENYSDKCAEIVKEALECHDKPNVMDADKFHWMEEIAECIFDDDKNRYKENEQRFQLIDKKNTNKEDKLLNKLRYYVGNESAYKKSKAIKALYTEFDSELMYERGPVPEYQNYFHRLFKGILVTTNYDKALEKSYPSLFSYSYKILNQNNKSENTNGENQKNDSEESWLYQAVIAKIEQMKSIVKESVPDLSDGVTVPEIPMLLKVHGTIEQANDIALSRYGYDIAYKDSMPKLLREIFKSTTVIFMGYSFGEDRILGELKKAKDEMKDSDKKFPHHFAILPKNWDNKMDYEFAQNLQKDYGIYTIFYDKSIMPPNLCRDDTERNKFYHDYCLGLLMENLLRSKTYYPRPLEMLWDKTRYESGESTLKASELIAKTKLKVISKLDSSYVRREEAQQIWGLLIKSEECPVIAITGEHGSGRSTLCKSIMEFQEGGRETLQFFYISLAHNNNWDEFCIQLYQALNIVEPIIHEQKDWKMVADKVNDICGGYWRSVLVLDHIDDLKASSELWETFKLMISYWKRHQTRVIFICQKYPEDISCYVWHVGELMMEDAKKVFLSVCISGRYREITYLEEKVINLLFTNQSFRASTVQQMGKYANCKGDLTSLYEEWELYYQLGDEGERTVARILLNHLFDEHKYKEKTKIEQSDIERNILWIWGILGKYPGNFPSEFLNVFLSDKHSETYMNVELSRKTLRFMKNIGLCDETEDEKENILLDNMVKCVRDYFLAPMSNYNSEIKSIKEVFEKNTSSETREGRHLCGIRDFRGYVMHTSQFELRDYAIQEIMGENCDEEKDLPANNIIEILFHLSKKVNKDQSRMEQRKLNLILHYEIKSVIRFLTSCLLDDRMKDKWETIFEIGYNFSHYYHYAPQNALMLVCRLLENPFSENTHNYKIAGMNRVLGDIYRLLGKKEESIFYYNKAIELCNQSLLEEFMKDNDTYKMYIHVKAGAILGHDYFKNDFESCKDDMKEAGKLFAKINDKKGTAYYHQRIGELNARQNKAINDNKNEKSEYKGDKLEEAIKHFNDAAKGYAKNNDRTGNAYILKCMGDLIIENIYIWENNNNINYILKDPADEWKNEEYNYFIIEFDASLREMKKDGLLLDAVKCYTEAFYLYYKHINWRGFANVIQAMGTCYRHTNNVQEEKFIRI